MGHQAVPSGDAPGACRSLNAELLRAIVGRVPVDHGVIASCRLNIMMTAQLRQWMGLAEAMTTGSILPTTVYHGTTARLWRGSGKQANFNLYVTSDKKDAARHAEEGLRSNRDKAIIIEFNMAHLLALAEVGAVELDPDWGWVDALENDLKDQGKSLDSLPTWEESLSTVQSFCVSGFKNSLKSLGKVSAD